MAWEAYTSDTLVDLPEVTCGGYCSVRGRVAYRLYVDDTDVSNPKIRIEITYFHVRSSLATYQTDGGGYWNAAAVSWFLGAYPATFNQSQFNLNQQRDQNGYYINTFAWPYNSRFTGSFYEEQLPSPWQNSLSDVNAKVYNNLPVFAITVRDDLRTFSGAQVSYGQSASNISGDPRCVFWGSVFADTSKYNGTNANGQSKRYTTSLTVDFATSALKTSSGSYLSYDNEWATSVSSLSVGSPYTSSQCLAAIETDKNTLESRGLVRYDPDFFNSNGVAQTYIIDGYVVPFTWWSRARNSDKEPYYYSTIERNLASEQQVVLKYDEFTVPSYELPDPVGVVDDNTVFRLKKQYDSSGHPIVDQAGNPKLSWIKCERIGQE